MLGRGAGGPTPPTLGGGSARAALSEWLSSPFRDNDSCYFTCTYSDAYGGSHGLWKPERVIQDVRYFLDWMGHGDRPYIVGVEAHKDRSILHAHGVLGGPISAHERERMAFYHGLDRGHSKWLPLLAGGVPYVVKYAVKDECLGFYIGNL